MVKNADGVDDHTKHKAKFYVEQIANALSPSNFAFTNPEVLRATLATNGANLIEGLKHLEEDLRRRTGGCGSSRPIRRPSRSARISRRPRAR